MFAWFAWTHICLVYPFGKHKALLHIPSSARVSNFLRGLFFTPSSTHTHTLTVTMGRWRGLPETGVDLARTFTADTFFAHLLTLRMFRVYVFMSISQSGHMADTNGTSDILFYVFFFIEVFPWTDIIFVFWCFCYFFVLYSLWHQPGFREMIKVL